MAPPNFICMYACLSLCLCPTFTGFLELNVSVETWSKCSILGPINCIKIYKNQFCDYVIPDFYLFIFFFFAKGQNSAVEGNNDY